MKRILIKISLGLSSLAMLLFFAATPIATAAPFVDAKKEVCTGVQLQSAPTDCDKNAGSRVNSILKTVINIFSVIIGVIAVIMLIIGGLKYITSGGDSTAVSSAKNTILYAVIGLIIVALAQVIVTFVLGRIG